MSINIWTDSMQHAALLGKPVLFTNWLIQRDIIPDGWYCYDLRGTHKSPSTRTTLVDHAADYHAGTVLSPIPLKHEGIVHDPLPPISTYYFNIRERRGFALKSSTFASHNE